MVNNKNELAAKEARILLHSEGDGTELPDLMGEKKVSPKDLLAVLSRDLLLIFRTLTMKHVWLS